MQDAYFFDTYALVEILKGNPNYARFKNAKIVITIFNLVELHYKLLRDFNSKVAERLLNECASRVVEVDAETIREANEFKLLHKAKSLSFPDAIGYIIAQRYGLKFLTGDKQFRGLKGVEFVK